jgi:hypothetical protein
MATSSIRAQKDTLLEFFFVNKKTDLCTQTLVGKYVYVIVQFWRSTENGEDEAKTQVARSIFCRSPKLSTTLFSVFLFVFNNGS